MQARNGSLVCFIIAASLLAAPSAGAEIPAEDGLVIRTVPLPTATPGDIAFDGEALWIADWAAGELLRFDPDREEVLQRIPAPCYRPRGLAWGGDVLYVADDYEKRVYQFDPRTGIAIAAYPAPSGGALGLAWDGKALWLANHEENTLQRLVPADGTVLTYFAAPHSEPGGMAYDGTYLWVAERNQDRIYAVDPATGAAITSFASPGPYPSGLAPAPNGRLWVADFELGTLALCAPREAQPCQVRNWRETEIRMTYRIENQGPGNIVDATIHLALPEPELENQVILDPPNFGALSPLIQPDEWGQSIATFTRARIAPGERFEAGYQARARIADMYYILLPERVGSLEAIPREIREAYTADGERFQVSSPLVRETAAGIVGKERNPYRIARAIYDWVNKTLEYERVGGWDVPETLIKRGTGSCSEYTFLFIALCRAAGLPARYEAGTALRGDDASVDDVHHRWAEVYLPGYGWVPFDPSAGDQPSPGGQVDAIGRLSNRLFVTTHSGGGSSALSWTYNAFAHYSLAGRCAVTEDEWFAWRRAKEEGEAVTPSGAQVKP